MKKHRFQFISINTLDKESIKIKFNRKDVFKYIILDNFIDKKYSIGIAKEHKAIPDEAWLKYNHYNQKKMGLSDLQAMGPLTQKLIRELSSKSFTNWLSFISNFENLISDPTLDGGGLHKISKGGYLNIHTDFQSHTKNKNWRRRINLLLYLSPEYKKSWKGELELRSYKDNTIVESIVPKFNRCVIFVTDNKSFHGHPIPLNAPNSLARRSIALYYFQVLDKDLPLKPTKYIPINSDNKMKKILIKIDVMAVYIFSFMKRYSSISNDSFGKIRKFFGK